MGALARLAVLCACSGKEAARTPPEEHALLPYTVRGRWENPQDITYAFTDRRGPLDPGAFQREIRRALKTWENGNVGFREIGSGQNPDVTFGWQGQQAEPSGSPGFLAWDGTLAHTGAVRPGTWIRFFDGVSWTAAGPGKHALYQTALHEIGHLIGLDHSPLRAAVMHPDHDPRRVRLTRYDLAALQTLYPQEDVPPEAGDLVITPHADTQGSRRPRVLKLLGLAPELAVAVLDTDGNGTGEILLWSKAPAYQGALAICQLDASFRLVKTLGPGLGIMPVRYASFFTRTVQGRPVLVHPLTASRRDAWYFDENGLPSVRHREGSIELESGGAPRSSLPLRADVNGDGLEDLVSVGTSD